MFSTKYTVLVERFGIILGITIGILQHRKIKRLGGQNEAIRSRSTIDCYVRFYKKFDVPIVSVFVNIGMRSSNGARDATKNSRHSVQVVYTTRVMGLGVFRQEWLQKRRTSM